MRGVVLPSEMDRPALSAEATLTSFPSRTAFGARVTSVLTTKTPPASGKTPTLPTPERIRDQHGTVAQLMGWAELWGTTDYPAVRFVHEVFTNPTRRKTGVTIQNARLVEGSLGKWEVLLVAKDWDSIGPSTPIEFVEGLAFEVQGHPKYEAMQSFFARFSPHGSDNQEDESEWEDEFVP